jgi:hypothetical protein
MEERIYIKNADREFCADVAVIEQGWSGRATQGGTGLADAPVVIMFEETRELYLEIVRTGDSRLITCIEVLSPGNKRRGNGREKYISKQQLLLEQDCNLLEIDLLRAGVHTVGVPKTSVLGVYDYLVCLHRSRASQFEIWPFSVRRRMPRVYVPLDGEEPDFVLDLNAALAEFYTRGFRDEKINYMDEPIPPLSPEDAAWSDQLLRAAGLRR